MSEPVRENTCAALVAAHSKMLGALSSDIAATVRSFMANIRKGNPEDVK